MRVLQSGAHCLDCLCRWAKRILVRGQLDNCAWMAIEFARRLLDWLSRFVNSKIAQLRVRQLPDRDHRGNLGRINRMNTMQLSRSRSPPPISLPTRCVLESLFLLDC